MLANGASSGAITPIVVLLRGRRDVFPLLLIEVVQQPLLVPVHLRFSVGRRICAIAPANFSHLLVATTNCFRPFAVKR